MHYCDVDVDVVVIVVVFVVVVVVVVVHTIEDRKQELMGWGRRTRRFSLFHLCKLNIQALCD